MADAKSRRRKDAAPPGTPKDIASSERAALEPRAAPVSPDGVRALPAPSTESAGLQSANSPSPRITVERTITRSTGRALSTFAGATQIRKEIALSLLEDGIAWARSVFHAAAQEPKNLLLGELALNTLRLTLDKTVGSPKEPYDEIEGGPPAMVADKIIIEEAQRVLKAQQTAPLEKYMEIAERGIVKSVQPSDGEPDPPTGH